jgi:hypothetical protein
MNFTINLKVCFIDTVKMMKTLLIIALFAIACAYPNPGGCHGHKNSTAASNSSSTTPTTVSNDGNRVIQARAQPSTTTESSQIDNGVEIVNLNRN